MRSDLRPALIDRLGRIARRAARLFMNGLAVRAGAVGGLPVRASSSPSPRRNR